MNQNFCRGLTAAVLLSTVGIPFSANAEQIPQEASATSPGTVELAADSPSASASALTPSSSDSARLDAQAVELSEILSVTAHTVENQQVAVLRIDNLPVFTFVDQSPSASVKENAVPTLNETSDPVVRAEQVAAQIDQFYQSSGDPNTIQARWDEDLEEYVISMAGESLVLINNATYYPNSTGDLAQDTLHATNRLRSLLGGAAPLVAVEGQPEPEAVAVRSEWDVTTLFTGQASWYGPGFHGRHTASGEVFNQNGLTAAHRTLPFGTQVRVTNMNNNRQVVVRINDRGPFSHGRVLDLSAGAARAIGLDRAGVGPVRVEVLSN